MKPVLILILLSMALLTAALSQWPEVVGTLTAASLAVLLWVAAYFIVLVASGAAAWKHNARQVQRAHRVQPSFQKLWTAWKRT
jgi:hypothetical protein